MPTLRTVIVDPGNGAGTDYLSLAATIAAESKDLVSLDRILKIICRGTGGVADTSLASIAGFTTDETRYLWITSEGYKHQGEWGANTNAYKLDVAGSASLNISDNNVIVHGLQIRRTGTNNGQVIDINQGGAAQTNIVIDSCIIRADMGTAASNSKIGILVRGFAGATCLLINNVIKTDDFSRRGIQLSESSGTGTAYLYNNTIIGKNIASSNGVIIAGNFSVTAINNIVQDFATNFSGTFAGGSAKNISDDATSASGTDLTTTTVAFEDAPNFNFKLEDNTEPAVDAGSTIGTFWYPIGDLAHDFLGNSRPQGSAIDIGAHEFPYPEIAVSDTELDYGQVTSGQSSTQAVTVSNSGSGNLEVTALNFSGTDAGSFSITSGDAPFTLAEGEEQEVEITFTPSSIGVKDAILTIVSNDVDESSLEITLTGEALSANTPVVTNRITLRIELSNSPDDFHNNPIYTQWVKNLVG